MKILGKSDNGYIVSVSNDEMANIMGKDSLNGVSRENVAVGSNVKLSEIYARYHEIMGKEDKIKNIIGYLYGIINSLKPMQPLIEEVLKKSDDESRV